MKSSNLRHSLAGLQNKGMSEYQRRASWLQNGPPTPSRRQRGSQKARGNLGPRDSILHQTVSRLPVANQVFLGSWMVDICQEGRSLRSAPQRRHTAHLRQCPCSTPRKRAAGTREVTRCTAHLGQCARQAPGHLSCSHLGRAQNACPTESVPLWSIREPERFRPGKCTKCRACFGQFPCRATWSLSSADQKSTCTVSWGKPSVVHTLWALPTHTSDICLQCSSPCPAQLNKGA